VNDVQHVEVCVPWFFKISCGKSPNLHSGAVLHNWAYQTLVQNVVSVTGREIIKASHLRTSWTI